MKKALLVIAVIAILSGCGTDEILTCTTDNTVGTLTSNTTYKISYRDNDVKKLMVTYKYTDNHVEGVGTGTDGTTEDDDVGRNGVVDGVVGEVLDDVVTGVTDAVLDIAGIKTRHNDMFGAYTNTEGFMTNIDMDDDTNYTVTYTYDLSKLTDDDIETFGINRDLKKLRTTYTDRGMTCK